MPTAIPALCKASLHPPPRPPPPRPLPTPLHRRLRLSRCLIQRPPVSKDLTLLHASPSVYRRSIPEHIGDERRLALTQQQRVCCPVDEMSRTVSLKRKEWSTRISHMASVVNPGFLVPDAVKFALLTGLLLFHGSQTAHAGTEIASGIGEFLGDVGDIGTGFASAFLLIFFSELGDKTFFIAALLAARNSAAVVFLGTFGALTTMTIISVILGRTFHYIDGILPFKFGGADLPIDDIAAVFLLVYFGVTTLIDAASEDSSKATDEQKEAELAVSGLSGNGVRIMTAANTLISTFLLVFVAEWGDKSFFSTIALAAATSPLGVVAGALAGHAVATLLAVVGGSLMGTLFSEKAISYVGGTLFLVFAAATLFEIIT